MGGAVPAMVVEKQAEERNPKRATAPDPASRMREDEDMLRRGLRGKRALSGAFGELGYLAPLGANPGRS